MTVSSDLKSRRRRYAPQPTERACSLTPARRSILRYVAELKVLSLPQIARLTCPSEKSASRHCRFLFDSGLLTVVPVARVAITQPNGVNDASLLFGSAPNVYTITAAGIKVLLRLGWDGEPTTAPRYGPRNSLFLGHELAIRDVRVWLELLTRAYREHRLERWVDGTDATLDLKRTRAPKAVHPDAWFVYRLGTRALIGLLEVDMGTERGLTRWKTKLDAYDSLYSGDRLQETTGYQNARVLVITSTTKRRDSLADLVAQHASPQLAARFWFTHCLTMDLPDLAQSYWRQPGSPLLRPLLPKEILNVT